MARPPGEARLDDVIAAFGVLLGGGQELVVHRQPPGRADLLLQAPDVAFAVEWKSAGDPANVGAAIRMLVALEQPRGRRAMPLVPVVAVPFMGETGRRMCADAGLSWIDLSGNGWIEAPGLRIRMLGQPNRFASRGRPADVFAPRSSRVVRALLMQPDRAFTQSELVAVTGVDKGRVSRLVRRLEAMELLAREGPRSVRVKDPAVALDAWREAYELGRHDIRRGHVAVRDADELVRRIAESSPPPSDRWALTGLAAAWRLTHHALFRLVTILVAHHPSDDWLRGVGFREEARGANLWIVRPSDAAALDGATEVQGVPCAHPLQVYLDLKAHPERAREAADELRRLLLDREHA